MSLTSEKKTVSNGGLFYFDERSPIEGVTVQVKGTRNISGTLFDGMYAIEIRPVDSVLVFSYEGYETKEVSIVTDRKEYNVMLKARPGATNMINATPIHTKIQTTHIAFKNLLHFLRNDQFLF